MNRKSKGGTRLMPIRDPVKGIDTRQFDTSLEDEFLFRASYASKKKDDYTA